MHILKAIGHFISVCEEYFEYRIVTGKFVGDLGNQNVRLKQTLDQKSKTDIAKTVQKSKAGPLLTPFIALWKTLLTFNLFEQLVALIAYALKTITVFSVEIALIFILTFPLIILLFSFFENAIVSFFIFLIPILLLVVYWISVLYYYIEKKSNGEKIALWQSFHIVAKNFTAICFPFIIQSAIILVSCVSFFIIAFSFSYLFDLTKFAWENSFIYWFLIIFLSIVLMIGLLLVTIIMHQAYFAVLFRQMPFQRAFRSGWMQLKQYPFQFFFFYVLCYLTYGIFAWRITLSYLFLGIALSCFFITILGLFLGYLLQKKFPQTTTLQSNTLATNEKTHALFSLLIGFGIVNYWLVSILFSKQYDAIVIFVQQQQASFLSAQDVQRYTNNVYRYTLEYPQSWTIYEGKNNTVTFYANYTGTIKGGTWFSIKVSPFDQDLFTQLYNVNPGIVTIDNQSNDILTKVSNIIVQNNKGVTYTYIKHGEQYNQYETHYLIHKGDYMYDLEFMSVSNDVNGYTSDLFDKIVNSFQFIE